MINLKNKEMIKIKDVTGQEIKKEDKLMYVTYSKYFRNRGIFNYTVHFIKRLLKTKLELDDGREIGQFEINNIYIYNESNINKIYSIIKREVKEELDIFIHLTFNTDYKKEVLKQIIKEMIENDNSKRSKGKQK